ncbi:protein YgfX [Azovibrio restrictus]|uniref:protein YgfX n=1 Tax=Azovibrio restrictus TaxID=146938 RepID=UPI0026F34BF2|nr:protein YgfX [Azovibrio restrictus]MDD3483322.1 hypothetical protein [Azovibrio restrictus]
MQFPVFVELHRSRLLLSSLALSHFLAALGIFLSDWPPGPRLFLILSVLGLFLLALRRWRQGGVRLCLQADGGLTVDGLAATRLPGGLIQPWLCVFFWRAGEGRRQTLVLLPDSSDRESLRRLRVWLLLARRS